MLRKQKKFEKSMKKRNLFKVRFAHALGHEIYIVNIYLI
jgi:hypothetical protein